MLKRYRVEGRREKLRCLRGDFRPPRKGEYYLSGAIVAAYKAPNDLSTAFRIVRPMVSYNAFRGQNFDPSRTANSKLFD